MWIVSAGTPPCRALAAKINAMTQLEVLYQYDRHPSEATIFAIGKMRDVYGVRRIKLDDVQKTVRVEYDATRLNKQVIYQLLRRTGLDITVEVPLVMPPPPADTAAEATPAQAK
jgi:hypothetical protein